METNNLLPRVGVGASLAVCANNTHKHLCVCVCMYAQHTHTRTNTEYSALLWCAYLICNHFICCPQEIAQTRVFNRCENKCAYVNATSSNLDLQLDLGFTSLSMTAYSLDE